MANGSHRPVVKTKPSTATATTHKSPRKKTKA